MLWGRNTATNFITPRSAISPFLVLETDIVHSSIDNSGFQPRFIYTTPNCAITLTSAFIQLKHRFLWSPDKSMFQKYFFLAHFNNKSTQNRANLYFKNGLTFNRNNNNLYIGILSRREFHNTDVMDRQIFKTDIFLYLL